MNTILDWIIGIGFLVFLYATFCRKPPRDVECDDPRIIDDKRNIDPVQAARNRGQM